MKKKKRYGAIEKRILELLNYYTKKQGYVELSLRFISEQINNDNRTDNSKYNIVRNAIDRLEEYNIIQTKVVPVYYGWLYENLKDINLSKLRMVRFYSGDKTWDCDNGIRVIHDQSGFHPTYTHGETI